MRKFLALLTAVASLWIAVSPGIAAPVNKCLVNGTVTYQSDPCPSGQPRKPPSIQELNAQEQIRRKAAAAAKPKASIQPGSAEVGVPEVSAVPAMPAMPTVPAPAQFHCDGRQRCSQMKSCAEAKYFLANCPGVEMDGDRNGIPCERQWCHG